MNLLELHAGLSNYRTALAPDEDTPDWWAGAPSAACGADGTIYLAARMREGTSRRGVRGYEIRILKSADGLRFETIRRIRREEVGVPGFERPALVRDPHSGRFKLYGCAALERGWAILKFDDTDNPADIDPASARTILTPESFEEDLDANLKGDDGVVRVTRYKDPFVIWDGTRWRMFVIAMDRVERIRQFLSEDGEAWRPASEHPAMENAGWHNFYTRPSCVLPLDVGYLFVYEGSNVNWPDPVYNISTGLAYSPDLERFVDLTPDEPFIRSDTPGKYHTWRYSHWLRTPERLLVYFEASCANGTNALRVAEFPCWVLT